jgi:hypothetical protein
MGNIIDDVRFVNRNYSYLKGLIFRHLKISEIHDTL